MGPLQRVESVLKPLMTDSNRQRNERDLDCYRQLARFARVTGMPDVAESWTQAAIADFHEAEASRGLAALRVEQAQLLAARGNPAEACELLDRAIQISIDCSDGLGEASALLAKAWSLRQLGQNENAKAACMAALRLAKGGAPFLHEIWLSLSNTYSRIGQVERAEQAARDALEVVPEQFDLPKALVFRELGTVLFHRGRLDEAKRILEEALALFERGGAESHIAWVHFLLAELEVERGQFAEADRHEATARRLVALGNKWLEFSLTQFLATRRWLDGDLLGAREHATSYVESPYTKPNPARSRYGLAMLGALEAALGEEGAAATLSAAKALDTESDEDPNQLAAAIYLEFEQIVRYQQAVADDDDASASDAARRIGDVVSWALTSPPTPPVDRSVQARRALALLRRTLPSNLADELEPTFADPGKASLYVGPDSRTFRVPGGEMVSLGRRRLLIRLLDILTSKRLSEPGTPISAYDLIEGMWPDERMLHEAALNRLYFQVTTMRKAGLDAILLSTPEGYLLDPEVDVVRLSGEE